MLTISAANNGFIGSIWCTGAFLAVFFLLNMIQIYCLRKYFEKEDIMWQERSHADTGRKFYVDLYAKADSQKDIILCKQTGLVERELSEILSTLQHVQQKGMQEAERFIPISTGLGTLSLLLIFLFFAVYGYYGIISIGSVISFTVSLRNMSETLENLAEDYMSFKAESRYAVTYCEFMELGKRKHEGTIPVEKRRDNKFSVEFEHVSFRYPDAKDYVLYDLNLNLTIGESLACSVDVDEAKAVDALERAGLSQRLRTLPFGLDTYIGKGFNESGVNFSGGEKQKLAIARAIYKDAPFVIMDEPTAALDPEAEAEVLCLIRIKARSLF